MMRSQAVFRASLLGAVACLALLCPARATEKEPFGSLTVDEVQKLVDTKGADIFDNNGQERWKKSHVPGAKWVNAEQVKAEDLPNDMGRKLVFYCANSH